MSVMNAFGTRVVVLEGSDDLGDRALPRVGSLCSGGGYIRSGDDV